VSVYASIRRRRRAEPATRIAAEKKKAQEAPKAWHFFITHAQSDGATLAEGIYHEFSKLGLKVWLDVKMPERDVAAMKEGIENSNTILVIVTASYFTREFCLKELRWARDAGKGLVVCIDVKDKNRIGEFLNGAPEDLKSIGDINFIDLNRGEVRYFKLGIELLLDAKPKKLALAAVSSPLSLFDRIAALENSLMGAVSQGGAAPRIATLEEGVLGAVSTGTLPARLSTLEKELGM